LPPPIRPAVLSDAPLISDLIREVAAELGWPRPEDPSETESQVAAQLEACLKDPNSHSVLVATEAGRVVGYLSVHWLPYLLLPGPVGYVSELFVRTEARSAGCGGALLARAEAEGRARGGFRLELLNKRDRESYRRGFYAKQGWSEREDLAVFNRSLRD